MVSLKYLVTVAQENSTNQCFGRADQLQPPMDLVTVFQEKKVQK